MSSPAPQFFHVGGSVWYEVPDGVYIAKCTKVITDFYGHKLVYYFTIIEGEHSGKTARLIYQKLSREQAKLRGTEFGNKSKLFQDLKKLFPDIVGDGSVSVELDLVGLFYGETFVITTEIRGEKKLAIIQNIEHYIGF